jgi:PTH1 family peptidyl-tRNA hydrolase
MVTIVALGNPGEMYVGTRHNVGWMVMEYVIQKRGIHGLVPSAQFTALVTDGVLHGEEVGVLFPTTFMNKSGSAVKRYIDAQDAPGMLVVVHDDIDIPFGTIRVSHDRGAGGHNGVRSIIQSCGGTDFVRIRVGIAHVGIFGSVKRPTGDRLSKYVLAKFKPAEMRKMDEVSEKVDRALELLMTKGLEKAMQACN